MTSESDDPVKVVHFADPWCWWSWGLEPVLRRLKEVYGDKLHVEYRMGGTFANYREWMAEYGVDERSAVEWIKDSIGMTQNPVDPEYLNATGVKSTFPACLAIKAAQLQKQSKAERYFRRLMEAFQIRSLPWNEEVLFEVGEEVGLDVNRLKRDMHSKKVEAAFMADMELMHKEGVNFLSLAVIGRGHRVVQSQVFTSTSFEEIVDRIAPGLPKRSPTDILEYLEKYKGDLVTTHEIGEVFRISDDDAGRRISELVHVGFLNSENFGGYTFWRYTGLPLEKIPIEVVKISHVPPEARIQTKADLTPIVTTAVQSLYTQVATEPHKEYHFPLGLKALLYVGYPENDLNRLPPTATESFAGVGYPFAANQIRPGDTVLDVGSGSGTDVLYALLKVGPRGKVYGLDMTSAMIQKARRNIELMGAKNIRILEGNATEIPLPDASVNVVTSNGVLNLVPDKAAAFHEIFRVLKPGGKLQLADIVVQEDVGAVCGINPQLWADCIGGAAVEAAYLGHIKEAGFVNIQCIKRLDYFESSNSEYTKKITRTFGAESIVLSAMKPQ